MLSPITITITITILSAKVIGDFSAVFTDTFFNSNPHVFVSRPFLVADLCLKVAVDGHPRPANRNLTGWATAADAGYCALRGATPVV